jgi:glutamyl-tRNA reductase
VATPIIVAVIRQLREKMNRVRERELAVALKRLPDLTPAQRATVERLSRALMTRFVREPSARLRAATAHGDGLAAIEAARYLFALDGRPDGARGDRRESDQNEQSGDVRAA